MEVWSRRCSAQQRSLGEWNTDSSKYIHGRLARKHNSSTGDWPRNTTHAQEIDQETQLFPEDLPWLESFQTVPFSSVASNYKRAQLIPLIPIAKISLQIMLSREQWLVYLLAGPSTLSQAFGSIWGYDAHWRKGGPELESGPPSLLPCFRVYPVSINFMTKTKIMIIWENHGGEHFAA